MIVGIEDAAGVTLDPRPAPDPPLDVERLRSRVSALVSPVTAERGLGSEPYPKGYVAAINDVLVVIAALKEPTP